MYHWVTLHGARGHTYIPLKVVTKVYYKYINKLLYQPKTKV
jgi:hypothetical protein